VPEDRPVRGRRILTGIVLVAALVAAAVVAGLGPESRVVCGRGHVLDRLAQAVMRPLGAGHIDGPAASLCVVPSTVAWTMAGITLLAAVSAWALAVRRRDATT